MDKETTKYLLESIEITVMREKSSRKKGLEARMTTNKYVRTSNKQAKLNS